MVPVETVMTKSLKADLCKLIKILAEGEYKVMTADGGDTYMFSSMEKNNRVASSVSWSDLCIGYIPKKLGIQYLIIPTNNEFNIAKYLIDYYNDLVQAQQKELIVDEDTNNPYALDGTGY